MIAYYNSPCYCTSTCCSCNGVQFSYTFSTPFPPRPPRLTLEEMRIPACLLKTWRIWTAWKREVAPIWEILLPTFDWLPPVLRPRTRERRHVQGHSPRRHR